MVLYDDTEILLFGGRSNEVRERTRSAERER